MTSRDVIDRHREAGRRFDVGEVSGFVREEGDGEPVFCLHGVPASSFLYRKVRDELAVRGLRGVAFDLPASGSLTGRPTSTTPGPAWAASASRRLTRSGSIASTSWCMTSAARSGSSWRRRCPSGWLR